MQLLKLTGKELMILYRYIINGSLQVPHSISTLVQEYGLPHPALPFSETNAVDMQIHSVSNNALLIMVLSASGQTLQAFSQPLVPLL